MRNGVARPGLDGEGGLRCPCATRSARSLIKSRAAVKYSNFGRRHLKADQRLKAIAGNGSSPGKKRRICFAVLEREGKRNVVRVRKA